MQMKMKINFILILLNIIITKNIFYQKFKMNIQNIYYLKIKKIYNKLLLVIIYIN